MISLPHQGVVFAIALARQDRRTLDIGQRYSHGSVDGKRTLIVQDAPKPTHGHVGTCGAFQRAGSGI